MPILAALPVAALRWRSALGALGGAGDIAGKITAPRVKVTLTHETNRWAFLRRAIREAGQQAVLELAEELAEDWRSRVHVISGEYRDSIRVVKQGNTVTVEAGVPYAHHEEFGTVHRAGPPAFVPAVERARQRLGGSLQKTLRDRLR